MGRATSKYNEAKSKMKHPSDGATKNKAFSGFRELQASRKKNIYALHFFIMIMVTLKLKMLKF